MVPSIVLFIILWINSESRSIDSQIESLTTCSKFHFEEKVLEKLIRIEHKMEVFEEKLKIWEESMTGKMQQLDEAESRRKISFESAEENVLEGLKGITRFNNSVMEYVNNINLRSDNLLENLIAKYENHSQG